MSQFKFIKRVFRLLRTANQNSYKPRYRVVEIFKEDDRYTVAMQIINKNSIFHANPEDILADDKFVDYLSPRDVRTLTYLGYLEINQPEYKLLAQRLSENSEVFVIKKRGDKKPIIKTVAEINQEAEILSSISARDAKTIGYALATNEYNQEKKEKDEISRELLH